MGYFNTTIKEKDNALSHHGILGQKWGVRRFQNADGTLTAKGRERISKKYQKLSSKASLQVNTTANYVKAYNKAADKMNNGLTDKYNKDYEKKLGKNAKNHDYGSDEKYNKGYEKLFEKVLDESSRIVTYEALKENKYYKKGKELVDKYGMTKWDDLARKNEAGMKVASKLKDKEVAERQAKEAKAKKWNDSKSYNKGFLDYLSKEGSKPEDFDDSEYLELIKMEYEADTGKKAMKD